jgi:predicted nucleotidyltransferase
MNQMNELEAVPTEARRAIERKLSEIEQVHDVRIIFAVESGSRAWGFPSPDSDYDVRFLYVHRRDWYLSIDPRRDVIELPIEGEFDINGWDIRKALQLLIKSNPVLLEWLRSPVIYRGDGEAMQRLADLGHRTAYFKPSVFHYLHLCESQYARFIDGKDAVPLKKYFYCLRPALALMWLRTNSNQPVPMSVPQLRAGLNLPSELSDFFDHLIAQKAVTKELGSGPRNALLDRFIEQEIQLARSSAGTPPPVHPSLIDDANALFRDLVRAQ